jgi:16S rRNA processing protein RimM
MRKREHDNDAPHTDPPTHDSGSGMVLLGRISAAQGLGGEVRIATFTETPENIAAYGLLTSGDGRTFRITALRPLKGANVVARLEGVTNRTEAELLRGLELFVARDCLPPTDDDEWYVSDLVGLSAFAPDGAEIGEIIAVQNYGAGDLLEIRPPGECEGIKSEDSAARQTLLVPFTEAGVPEVDIAGGRVVVVRPEEIDAGSPEDS